MVKFFRDVLNGPLYIIVVILSIIFIMAIIGFIMERKQKEKESKEKVAFVSRNAKPTEEPVPTVNPTIEPVNVVMQQENVSEEIPVNNGENQ